jgi:hypothetical protein
VFDHVRQRSPGQQERRARIASCSALREWLSLRTCLGPRRGTVGRTRTVPESRAMRPSVASWARRRGRRSRVSRRAAVVSRRSSATAVGPSTAVQNRRTYGESGATPTSPSCQSRGVIMGRLVALARVAAPGLGTALFATGGRASR